MCSICVKVAFVAVGVKLLVLSIVKIVFVPSQITSSLNRALTVAFAVRGFKTTIEKAGICSKCVGPTNFQGLSVKYKYCVELSCGIVFTASCVIT